MSFLAAERLWLLAAVVGLVAAYVAIQRRRSRFAVRFTSIGLLDKVAPTQPLWRRHIPAALFAVMTAVFIVAFAQPADAVQVPRERATVVVALDISMSMGADDVDPTRLAAAQAAAREFVGQVPADFNVGLVSFAGTASLVTPPTTDRELLDNAIAQLGQGTSSRTGTAIGSAVETSLQAIRSLDARAPDDPPPARIVVLSDGANTAGVSPDEAAQRAADAEVPTYAISFGTEEGEVDIRGRTVPVPVDGETLAGIAEATGGEYYEAASTEQLRAVYTDIGSSIGYRTEMRDISARFVGAGLLVGLVTAGTSLAWFSRLP